MEPILRAEKLTKRFGELTANREIDIEIHAGEIHAIAGENGAGKSTLCSLIPRFYDVTEGAVKVDGTDVRDLTLKSLRDHIGMVQQDVYLFVGTVYELSLIHISEPTRRS